MKWNILCSWWQVKKSNFILYVDGPFDIRTVDFLQREGCDEVVLGGIVDGSEQSSSPIYVVLIR